MGENPFPRIILIKMTAQTGPTSPLTKKLVEELREAGRLNNAPIWDTLAEKLSAPARSKAAVNLSRICRFSKNGDTVVVPGKVLSAGALPHSVTVYAMGFSQEAARKITSARGKALNIRELVRSNPKGSNVKVLA